MVGTAAALLSGGCSSSGTTSAGTTSAGAGGGTAGTAGGGSAPSTSAGSSAGSSAATETPPNEAFTDPSPSATLPTGPAGKTTVYGCDRQPASQPKAYTLACGDGGVALEQLVWADWGKSKATATGVQIQNSCVPSCAAGAPVSTKATATLTGLTGGHYTKLHVVTAKAATDYTITTTGPLAAG